MIKNLTGGSVLNYGPTLPDEASTFDGTLFYKTSGSDQGLHLFGFSQDANAATSGDQSVQNWMQVQFPGLYVDATGDSMTGDLTMATGALSVNTNNLSASNPTLPLSFSNNSNFVWKKSISGGSAEMMRLTDTGVLQLMANGSWEKVWHSGNDGTNSGLDADLLDGQSSSYYLNLGNLTGTLDASRLSFMPVEQTGSSKVRIGWLGAQLGLTVDATNFGASWPISVRGSAASATTADSATNATNATEAVSARYLHQGGTVNGAAMTFNWAGQGGQPTWLWGGNDVSNMYVYNPSNFSVSYAASAGSVPWNNVTGRPTQVSQFPDAGNYATNSSVTTTVNNTVNSAIAALLPRGSIIMWTGSTAPAGWLLCNGTNGTPDLRDRFIVGAGASYGVGATGGAVVATSSWNGDHSHTTSWYGGFVPTGYATGTALTIAQMPSHQHKSWGESDGSWPYGNSGSRGNRGSGASDWDNYLYLTEPVGGNEAHTHGLAMDAGGGHNHTTDVQGGHNHTIDTRSPYYALAYIMKA